MNFAKIFAAGLSAMALSSPAWASADRASSPCIADVGLMKKLVTRSAPAPATAEPTTSGQTLATLKKLEGNTIGTQVGAGPSQDVPISARILTRDMPLGQPGRNIQGSCF